MVRPPVLPEATLVRSLSAPDRDVHRHDPAISASRRYQPSGERKSVTSHSDPENGQI
jgi:hypothetical protein